MLLCGDVELFLKIIKELLCLLQVSWQSGELLVKLQVPGQLALPTTERTQDRGCVTMYLNTAP